MAPTVFPETAARPRPPNWVALVESLVGNDGNLYISDYQNHRIRKVNGLTGVISTIAGNGSEGFSGDNGSPTAAKINAPLGLAMDSNGNFYFADTAEHCIRKVDSKGTTITTVAGTGGVPGFSGDNGPAASAKLAGPLGLAFDKDGNLLIADVGNSRVRLVDKISGIITTIAGNGSNVRSGDGGPAINAGMAMEYIAADGAGNLYISDRVNNCIRMVDVSGTITTYAGNGTAGFSGDGGPAPAAELNNPEGVAVDASGNVYIADSYNQRIRMVAAVSGNSTAPTIGTQPTNLTVDVGQPASFSVVATGTPAPVYQWNKDGAPIAGATAATYTTPATDFATYNNSVFSVDVTNVAGHVISNQVTLHVNQLPIISVDPGYPPLDQTAAIGGTATFSVIATGYPAMTYTWFKNGTQVAQSASPTYTTAPASASDNGAVFFVTISNSKGSDTSKDVVLTTVDKVGNITTVAGDGGGYAETPGNNVPATTSSLFFPFAVAVDTKGNFYVTDDHSLVRKIDSNHLITTVAGNGTYGFSGDGGKATSAAMTSPAAILVDSDGNLYIADPGTHRIRKVNGMTGVISTFVGNGSPGFSGDNGPPTSAKIYSPIGMAMDSNGNLYFSDSGEHCIRKVDGKGTTITTVAGIGGVSGFSGDNGLATNAKLNAPFGLALDKDGNLLIADIGNNRVRRVDKTSGIITTVAGNGSNVRSGDGGPAINAGMAMEYIAADGAGNLYISDRLNNCISIVDMSGTITTYAGNGTAGFSGDGGPAPAAELDNPEGVAVDASGNVYIADLYNNRIRMVSLQSNGKPSITNPTNQTVTVGNTATFSVTATGNPTPTYQWKKNGTAIAGATSASYTTPSTVAADNGAIFSCVASNSAGSATSNGATLTVQTPPTINTQPVDQTINLGQTATFSVVAVGNPPPAYQWKKNGTAIAGATSASYTTPATVATDDGAIFVCIVSNSVASITSNNAKLSVLLPSTPPSISVQPADQTVSAGQLATFTIAATGNPSPAYQWQKNSVNITGATSTSYTTPSTALADDGTLFRCVVTNSAGTVTSSAATLTVKSAPVPPVISVQPADQTVTVGQSASFSIVATGDPTLLYQWNKNGNAIVGAISSNYTTPSTTLSDNAAVFTCSVSNGVGSVTSSLATLTVQQAPLIVTQPANQAVNQGQSATFSVAASGNPSLTYLWEKNGFIILGADTPTYTTPPTVASDNGSLFACTVSNSLGSVTSSAATLLVSQSVAGDTVHRGSDNIINLHEGKKADFGPNAQTVLIYNSQGVKVAEVHGAELRDYEAPGLKSGTYLAVVDGAKSKLSVIH